jgi:hypothetical protein
MLDTTTYAEVKGAPPFDWNHFLRKPSRTKEEWDDAHKLAGQWVTCACGNQCAALPRDPWGVPIDYELKRLGCDFADFIALKQPKAARRLLEKIEARTTELLAPRP